MTQLYPIGLFVLTVAATPALHAQSAYTSGHGDIGVEYEDGDFVPHWHLGASAVVDGVSLTEEGEYAPGQIFAQTVATRLSPSGLSSSLGVADGTEIFVMGSSAYLPNLGFAVEELDSGVWDGDITLTLSGWTTPVGADFALYTTDLGGSSVTDIVFSSYDSGATVLGNELPLTPGDHTHLQWGFTTAGTYDLEFTWSGTHVTDGFISTTSIFTVQAVPEPATTALLMVSMVGVVTLCRRRRVV
jgi:surface-anchored protein